MSLDKSFRCDYCGRRFIQPVPHKCRGNFRKRHIKFTDMAIKKLNPATEFEKMLMWTSYRYCIGRKSYVVTMADEIALNEVADRNPAYEVKWFDGRYIIRSKFDDADELCDNLCGVGPGSVGVNADCVRKHFLVIGNIYDNPDLIKRR